MPTCYRYTNVNNSNPLNSKVDNCFSGVINLSSRILTEAELSLLSKGLHFVDTPSRPDMGSIIEDLSKFNLSIKRHLAAEKLNLPQSTNPNFTGAPWAHQKFKKPSRRNPPAPAILEHMSLLTIVIKKPDKGSAVVIQNREDYIKEGLRQLSDMKFYLLQEDNLTPIHSKLIKDAVKLMMRNKEISMKTAEYLIPENA